MASEEDIVQLVEQVSGELGLVLVDYRVAVGISGGAGQLQLYCGGKTDDSRVTSDDCAALSLEVGYRLEATGLENYFPGGYRLEVSTPGLYRKLRSDRELSWAVGRRIKAVRSAGGSPLVGVLKEVDGDRMVVVTHSGEEEASRRDMTRIKLHPDLQMKKDRNTKFKGGSGHGE